VNPEGGPRTFTREPGCIARGFRIFIGLVYLFGAPTHVYFALWNPDGYRGMSDWSPPITSLSRDFWLSWFLPNARYLGLLIAVVELIVAVLILSRGRTSRLGFGAAALFHVALAALFGMWPYTVPMILVLAYMVRFDFPRGPTDRFVHL
jgi:hypothetical protein